MEPKKHLSLPLSIALEDNKLHSTIIATAAVYGVQLSSNQLKKSYSSECIKNIRKGTPDRELGGGRLEAGLTVGWETLEEVTAISMAAPKCTKLPHTILDEEEDYNW